MGRCLCLALAMLLLPPTVLNIPSDDSSEDSESETENYRRYKPLECFACTYHSNRGKNQSDNCLDPLSYSATGAKEASPGIVTSLAFWVEDFQMLQCKEKNDKCYTTVMSTSEEFHVYRGCRAVCDIAAGASGMGITTLCCSDDRCNRQKLVVPQALLSSKPFMRRSSSSKALPSNTLLLATIVQILYTFIQRSIV